LLFRLAKQAAAIAYPLHGCPSRISRALDAGNWRGRSSEKEFWSWRFLALAAPLVLYC
jgi:hypothetical protein